MNRRFAPTIADDLDEEYDLEPVLRLGRDLRAAAEALSDQEVRYLVDLFYQVQDFRKAAANERRAAVVGGEPNRLIDWTMSTMTRVESQIKAGLDGYTAAHPVGRWSRSITGVGPILAAGLLAHIDITRSPTVGHIWSFAGVNPTQVWNKGERRPWNARLKLLLWKLGESFVKVSGRESDVYGKIYAHRRALEESRNAAGDYRAQAEHSLATKKYGHDTEAYKAYIEGRLPPARLYLRCKRYAVKLFLSHWHEVAYFNQYHTLPPLPYPLVHLEGHVHLIRVPNADLIPGLVEAQQASNRPGEPSGSSVSKNAREPE